MGIMDFLKPKPKMSQESLIGNLMMCSIQFAEEITTLSGDKLPSKYDTLVFSSFYVNQCFVEAAALKRLKTEYMVDVTVGMVNHLHDTISRLYQEESGESLTGHLSNELLSNIQSQFDEYMELYTNKQHAVLFKKLGENQNIDLDAITVTDMITTLLPKQPHFVKFLSSKL